MRNLSATGSSTTLKGVFMAPLTEARRQRILNRLLAGPTDPQLGFLLEYQRLDSLLVLPVRPQDAYIGPPPLTTAELGMARQELVQETHIYGRGSERTYATVMDRVLNPELEAVRKNWRYKIDTDRIRKGLERLGNFLGDLGEKIIGLSPDQRNLAMPLFQELKVAHERAMTAASFLPGMPGPSTKRRVPGGEKGLTKANFRVLARRPKRFGKGLNQATAAFADLTAVYSRQTQAARMMWKLADSPSPVKEPLRAMSEIVAILRRHSGAAMVVGVAVLCGLTWGQIREVVA